MAAPGSTAFHIVMYPWFAVGHITPYLHVANKLAEKGPKISFLIPPKAKSKFEQFNLHPDLITFIPITLPHVEGLPQGVETTADVPAPLRTHIMTAMDRTESDVEVLLGDLKPNFVFFDLACWIPRVANHLGIKSINFCVISASAIAYRVCHTGVYNNLTIAGHCQTTGKGFPESSIKHSGYETRQYDTVSAMEFGSNRRFCDRLYIGHAECDALGFKTCREIEDPFIEYLATYFLKPVLLTGLVMPGQTTSILEAKWAV